MGVMEFGPTNSVVDNMSTNPYIQTWYGHPILSSRLVQEYGTENLF